MNPYNSTEDQGKSLFEVAADLVRAGMKKTPDEIQADHGKAVAERVLAKQVEAARKEDDYLYTRIVEEVRAAIMIDKPLRNDVVGEATFGREQRAVSAWILGDKTELGEILSEGMTAEFMRVVARRVKDAS